MDANKGYRIAETFASIQGEGRHMGYTSVFLRLQFCSVGCPWCDSKVTWAWGGYDRSLDQIAEDIGSMPATQLIIVTGGEPLQQDLDPLFAMLKERFPEREVHIETSGVFPFRGELRPDWITLSPKYTYGTASKRRGHWHVENNVLENADELKYVVDEDFSPDVVHRHLEQIREIYAERNWTWVKEPVVYLMPEGAPPRSEMVEKAIEILNQYPDWRFGPRLQYAYPEIGRREGNNNKIRTVAEAKEIAISNRSAG